MNRSKKTTASNRKIPPNKSKLPALMNHKKSNKIQMKNKKNPTKTLKTTPNPKDMKNLNQ